MKLLHLLLAVSVIAGNTVIYARVAQPAVIKGTVRDEAGYVLPGVRISVINQESKVSKDTITDEGGNFVVESLAAGKYTVEAELKGFKRFTRSDLELFTGSHEALNVTLQLWDMPSHLGQTTKRFSVRIERKTESEKQRELITKAEQLPCRNGTWWRESGEGLRIPICLNREALDYYVDFIEEYKKGRHPLSQKKIQRAEAFYGANARFQTDQKQWIIELRLEYSHWCGNVCGITFVKTRIVVFDESGNLVKVVGDGQAPPVWIS